MQLTKRIFVLALAGAMLAGCSHKDRNAPLAYVPADTPYVVANLKVMGDDARTALLAQADAQLPSQLAQMDALATRLAPNDPGMARLIQAFEAAFKGGSIESFTHDAGIDLKGRMAFYGLGLSPVLRFDLADPKAFDGFVKQLETAYGKPLATVTEGGLTYHRAVTAADGMELVLAVVGKQAVIALLPANPPQPLLREALGLQRPARSMLDSDGLKDLAEAKGYQPWLVGEVDVQRLLPLLASGKDPLFAAVYKAGAERESAQTGEPVDDITRIPPSCETDAARIAARVPQLSFGYTQLDGKHQDTRADITLASDIVQTFAGLKAAVPGLGADGDAPFDLSLALPMAELRSFWMAQANAVAAKPFACPVLDGLNDAFAKLGQAMDKAAIPPFGDLVGLHLALDSFTPAADGGLPKLRGLLIIATRNPAGLLGMGQMSVPALSEVRVPDTGVPTPLPANLTHMLGEPAWAAMNDHVLALAIGQGEEPKLAAALAAPGGNAGQLMRAHVDGAMYVAWIKAMSQKFQSMANTGQDSPDAAQASQLAAIKSHFASLQHWAAQVSETGGEVHMGKHGLVLTNHLTLK